MTSSARRGLKRPSRMSSAETYGAQLVERDASGRLLDVIETVREPVAGEEPHAHDRRAHPAPGDAGPDVGHGGGQRQPGRDGRHEPADRRDPGDGVAAVVRQQQVRLRHQHRGLQRLPGRSGATAAQPRDQRHLPAGVDVQARHGHRRDGGGRDDPDPAVADVRLLPDPRRAEGRVPLRLESPGVRAARDGRRLREELRHLLLSDGRPHRGRPARPVGQRPRLRRAVRDPPAGRVGRDHRQHGVGARPGSGRRVHR